MTSIRELRQNRGWTQYELALKVGVQAQAVYLWESGRRMPQVPQMRKLGEIFGICSDLIDLDVAAVSTGTAPQEATDAPGLPMPESPDPDDDPHVV